LLFHHRSSIIDKKLAEMKRLVVAMVMSLVASQYSYAQYSVWTWGRNISSQLGDGIWDLEEPDPAGKTSPAAVTCYDDWKVISAGSMGVLALRQDGSMWTWGRGVGGLEDTQVEWGNLSFYYQTVATQIGTDKDWKAVSIRFNVNAAIKADGSLWTWGRNSDGVLGDGTNVDRLMPGKVGGHTDWLQISVHTATMIGLKADGTLWSWGSAAIGLLGDGSTTDRNVPGQIGSDTDWKVLATESGNACAAIKWDRSLWTWGHNGSGALGIGPASIGSSFYTPQHVGIDKNWKAVSCGTAFMVAIKEDGSLWSWGLNSKGQLGDGTNTNRDTPQRVGTDNDWKQVAAGEDFVLAIKTDGSLWAWGTNYAGHLSYGNKPQRIGNDSNWKAVSGGNDFAVALKAEPFEALPVPLDLGSDIIGCQSTAQLTSNITDATVYKWFTPSDTVKAQSTFTATEPGSYKLTVTKAGCRRSDEINVSLGNASQGSFSIAGTEISGCAGYYDLTEPLVLTNTTGAAGSFSWSFGNGASSNESNPSYQYPASGHYTITLNTTGCTGLATREVDVQNVLSLGPDKVTCQPPVQLSANITDADTYAWQTPTGPVQNQKSIMASTQGNYTVTIGKNGCVQTDEIMLTLNQRSESGSFVVTTAGVLIDDGSTVLRGVPLTFVNTNETGDHYVWTLGDGNSSSQPSFQHTYTTAGDHLITLTGTDDNGCAITAEKNIHVQDMVVTTAISANGDGKNDKLYIRPWLYDADLTVTDRTGKTVFAASPYQDDFTGNNLEPGIYYYELKFQEIGKNYKGSIHIIK
jgi:alpha-tubulin suppressor-like RCC1 family protein/PKD repeat protein